MGVAQAVGREANSRSWSSARVRADEWNGMNESTKVRGGRGASCEFDTPSPVDIWKLEGAFQLWNQLPNRLAFTVLELGNETQREGGHADMATMDAIL